MVFRKKSNWTVEAIHQMILEGKSLKEIGFEFNVSKQRIDQIRKKYKLPKPVEVRREERNKKYFKKWGQRASTDPLLYRELRSKFSQKKANSVRLGYEWDLEFGDVVWPTHCPVLGMELEYFSSERVENKATFDRLDPSKGYVKGNVVIISWRANRIKNDGNAAEHQQIADYILSHGVL